MSKGINSSDNDFFNDFVDGQMKLIHEYANKAEIRNEVDRLVTAYNEITGGLGGDNPNLSEAQSSKAAATLAEFKDLFPTPGTVLREATDRAQRLMDSSREADILFNLRFLIYFQAVHYTLDGFVRNLKCLDSCVKPENADTARNPAHYIFATFHHHLHSVQDKEAEFEEDASMEIKEKFRRILAFAAYFNHSCEIRQKLLDSRAGKIEGTDNLKTQIRQLKKIRQPFEDVIKSYTDDIHYDVTIDSSIRDLLDCQEQLKAIGFNSKQTPFQKMRKVEGHWENELGFGKK